MTREEILCKICEWVSRSPAKGERFRDKCRNAAWREQFARGLNGYIGKPISLRQWYTIYDRIGNGVNHELTVKFVRSGFDMAVLEEGEVPNE